jgi:hypothetical protein
MSSKLISPCWTCHPGFSGVQPELILYDLTEHVGFKNLYNNLKLYGH